VSLGLALWITLSPAALASSAIFGGGPFYSGGTATMNALRASGYTTVNLWTLHVYADAGGSLIYNDQLVVANGAYVGNAAWPAQLATLKTAPTSVKRIEWSVGSWGANDFLAIKTLMDTYGTNPDSLLYRNFLALKNATGADAIQFDDETQYDVTTAVRFGRMLSAIGYKVALCPYTNPTFWQSVYNQLGTGIVDAVYLQCYAGGAWNDPAGWNSYFTGTKVIPGMWCRHDGGTAGSSASEVQAQMTSWRSSAGITGGFMWLYDDMLSLSGGDTPATYATAINMAVNPMTPPPVTEIDLGFTGGSFAPLAANNLLQGNAGDSSALNFFEASGGWTPANLTDGDVKAPGSVGNGSGVYSILTSGTVTYQLGGGANTTGYNITGIRALTSWQGGGRVNPDFSASYSLDGVIFYPLATVNFSAPSGSQGADLALAVTGLTNVRAIRFTFPNTQQNNGVSYTELAVFGSDSPLPAIMPTQVVLNSSASPSAPGGSVTFTASVQFNGVTAASATGNIVFQVDGSDVATSAVANGTAIYTTSGLTVGWHTLTAAYSGDASHTASAQSMAQGVYFSPPVTETDLSFSSGSFAPLAANNLILGNAGDSSALAYFEAGAGWTPTHLTDGDVKAPGSVGNGTGVYSIVTGGSVTYPLGKGANGTGYTITGIRVLTSWQGGGRVNPDFSAMYSLDGVSFYPLATANFSAPTGSQGADVALGVSGLKNVTSIRFTFPNTQQNGGVSYTELAVFGTSSGLTNLTPTQTALSTSANPSTPGTSVTFTATVQENGVTAVSATGNIIFEVDGSGVATSAIANGTASYTASTLAVGGHTLTAVYSGDAGYATSTNSLTQTVYQPPSVTETDLSLTSGSFATLAANNLILGNAGTSSLTTVTYTGTSANLTDGVLQAPGSPGTSSQIVMIKSGAVTYSLGNGSAGLGFTLTGIRALTSWTNNTRINPKFTVSGSADGVTFTPLATVSYSAPTGAKGTDVTLAISGATHVKYLQFTFPNSQQNSGVAYSELAAYGPSTPGVPVSLSAQILLPERTSVVLNLNGLVTGQSYTVQSSPSLAAGSWSDEVTFTATQATAALTYPMGGDARRFYRLKY